MPATMTTSTGPVRVELDLPPRDQVAAPAGVPAVPLPGERDQHVARRSFAVDRRDVEVEVPVAAAPGKFADPVGTLELA